MRMRTPWRLLGLSIVLVLLVAYRAQAQDAPPPQLAEITLVDGTVIRGHIVTEAETYIILESTALGRMQISRDRIRSIAYGVEGGEGIPPGGWRQDPDYNSLLLVPTAETLPKGDIYYRNFELLFNNLGYAVTDYLNISVMAAFPITSELRIFSAGAKLRLLSREKSPVSIAASASGWFAEDVAVGTTSAIFSAGNRRYSFTLAGNYGWFEDSDEFFVFLGGDVQVATGLKLLLEYGNSQSAVTEDNDFKGLVNIGLRLFWEKVSFTMTGFRPLEDTGDFIAFPLVMFSAHF
jgi:hypothetical protein